MNIYLLENTDDDSPMYDVTLGYVIAALDEEQARHLVGDVVKGPGARLSVDFWPGDEGADTWLDPERSSCQLVGHAVGTIEPYVILRSFNPG